MSQFGVVSCHMKLCMVVTAAQNNPGNLSSAKHALAFFGARSGMREVALCGTAHVVWHTQWAAMQAQNATHENTHCMLCRLADACGLPPALQDCPTLSPHGDHIMTRRQRARAACGRAAQRSGGGRSSGGCPCQGRGGLHGRRLPVWRCRGHRPGLCGEGPLISRNPLLALITVRVTV